LFVRDELITWQNIVRKPLIGSPSRLRDLIGQNVRLVLNRAQQISCKAERDAAFERPEPLNQTILDMISRATNPLTLAQMDISFMAML
jgi:transformation/transcription domain-associated protein